jgi:hypothetical protein
MSISGITHTTVNGVREVTAVQNMTAAAAATESLLLHTSGALRVSGSNTVVLQGCNIFVNDLGPTAAAPNIAPLSYNADSGDRVASGRALRLRQTSLVFRATGRRNIFLSELTDCAVQDVDNSRNLFVYTQPGAILNNVRFAGCNTWEVVGAPAQAAGLSFSDVGAAFFNFEAGRLDFVRINVASFVNASCYIGPGSASNAVWNWNPVSFDRTRVARSIAAITGKTGRSEDEARAALSASNPQGRLITPDEVATTIVWLCGDGASGVNGAAVPVAGGEL